MPFAQINSLRLHYELTIPSQPGDARPAVVLLHGLGSSAADWALQAPVFAEHHRVLTLDLRAHGQSSDPGDWFTVETLAEDVAALLAHLNEAAAHVMGLSLGGCVALALAIRRPARVRSLTLVNSFAKMRSTGWRGVLRIATRLGMLLFTPMSTVAAFVARGLFPKPEQRPFYEAAVASLSQNRKRAYFAAMRALAVFDARQHLPGLRCPTLVVAGDRDATIPLAAKTYLQSAIPGAQLLVIPDSGHATPYDQSEVFNRAVLDFIAAH